MLRRITPLWAITATLCAAGCTRYAFAWNSAGHETVALIAYDQMPDATKAKAVELLRAHPRFRDHFEFTMQREVGGKSDAEMDEWLFAYAATWPDLVRDSRGGVTRVDVQQYSRPIWHYVDLPLFLNETERQRLESTVKLNLRRDVSDDHDDPNMNVIQAIKNSSRIVADKNAAPELRSIHLCWLLHLVGDSHQPLHSTALFTRNRFPDCDRGGNLLNIEHDYKLHSFWDSQVSTEEQYDTIRRLALLVSQKPELVAAGRKSADALDPGTWIDEGHVVAKQYVYTPEVLQKVADREDHFYLGPLHLPESYYADAQRVAEQRAVVAGYRLAALLNQLLE